MNAGLEGDMVSPLASLRVQNFRSIADATIELNTAVTLLIGANGAGKSNIVDAFSLLGNTVDQNLQRYVDNHGGFYDLVHRARDGGSAERITLTAWGEWADAARGRFRNGYQMRLRTAAGDRVLVSDDELYHGDGYEYGRSTSLSSGPESGLSELRGATKTQRHLYDVLSGLRVFHFDDTGIGAPPLRRSDVANGESLMDDARNIASVLLSMRENHPWHYRAVVRSVQNVAPFFDDFVLTPDSSDRVILRWREHGVDDVFSGNALSSGTLRFICLAVLLQQPNPPQTIVLDEPELGLHPAAIHQLAGLLRLVGEQHRVVAATQSVTLLGQFSIHDIAVIDRDAGATTVQRPNISELEAWLDDYSVGELWEMNLLGGRPSSPERVAR